MAVCAEYRIPHSHFLGGQLEWSQADRDKAITWQRRQSEYCRGCGTHPDDWNESKGGNRHAYEAEIMICPGCEVRQREEAKLQTDQWKKVRGALVRLHRVVSGRGW